MQRVGHTPGAQYPCPSRGKMAMQGMNPVKNPQPWVKLYGASREDQGKRIPHTLYLKTTAKSSSTGQQTCKKCNKRAHQEGAHAESKELRGNFAKSLNSSIKTCRRTVDGNT